jgi:hypothetical protein
MFQSKNYIAAIQGAQKPFDLIHQAKLREDQYRQQLQQLQQQLLVMRTVEIVVAVAVPVIAAGALVIHLSKRKRQPLKGGRSHLGVIQA